MIKKIIRTIKGFFNIYDDDVTIEDIYKYSNYMMPMQISGNNGLMTHSISNITFSNYTGGTQQVKITYMLVFSSERALSLTEDEILSYINPIRAVVEVLSFSEGVTHNKDDCQYIPLDDFLKEFRPDIFEKYKLLLEK